nr:oligosaccharide flippase family protein [uncultured Roseateles sp.]
MLASSRNLIDLASLFASKTGGLFVALMLLPLIAGELGPARFGIVTVIIAVQTFFTVADFGVSAYLVREMAVPGRAATTLLSAWHGLEKLLLAGFAGLSLIAAVIAYLRFQEADQVALTLGTALLVVVTVLQNVAYSCLVARKDYLTSSAAQSIFVLLRAGLSLLGLRYLSNSVEAFVLIQAIVLALHLAVSRRMLKKSLHRGALPLAAAHAVETVSLRSLFLAVRPLALAGIAGAAVTQIDKPLIAALVSPAAVSYYFLAYSLCSTPAGILAGPIAQFFQPRTVALLSHANEADQVRGMRNFSLALAGAVVVPALAMWLFRRPLVDLWLPSGHDNRLIAEYAAILLPAFTLGALGYVPVILLISAGEYRFHARTALFQAILTLLLLLIGSSLGRIDLVCWVYAAHFLLSYLLYLARALMLPTTRRMAQAAMHVQLLTTIPLIGLGWILSRVLG